MTAHCGGGEPIALTTFTTGKMIGRANGRGFMFFSHTALERNQIGRQCFPWITDFLTLRRMTGTFGTCFGELQTLEPTVTKSNPAFGLSGILGIDRKSTRLNSSHLGI